MIRLHLLGFTPDLKGLVFSGRRGGRSGTYWLPVDDDLLRALEQLEHAREEKAAQGKRPKAGAKKATPRTPRAGERHPLEELFAGEADEPADDTDEIDVPVRPATPRVESRLSPREVQQLLREGRTVKDVAKLAGVEPEWVERFTGPVRAEKAGVVQMTREAVQSRARLGTSALPIGEAVLRNLEARKATPQTLEEAEENWEARSTRARLWRVRLAFKHRGKRRTAEWEFRKDTGEVRPRNKLAGELGWWRSGSAAAGEARDGGQGEAGEKPPRRRAAKAAKRSSGAKKKPAGKKKPTARKAAAKKPKASGKRTSPKKKSSGVGRRPRKR